MRSEACKSHEPMQIDWFEDQYQRPSCKPIEGAKELEQLLGPGTKQLLRLLNSM